jgi:hypothetical protein
MKLLSPKKLEKVYRSEYEYFSFCLGSVALMLGLTEWIMRGGVIAAGAFDWFQPWMGFVLAAIGLLLLQYWLLVCLVKRLSFLSLNKWWIWPALLLWVVTDTLLFTSQRGVCMVLILAYGWSQVPLFVMRPKRVGSPMA